MANGSYNGFPAATAATLIGTTMASNVVTSSLTQVGTIATGVWQGTPVADSYVASSATWNAKQAALVSGTNLKTVNGISLLGSGDISFLEGGGQISVAFPVDGTKEVLSHAPFAFDYLSFKNVRLASGTMTLDIKINGTAITGLNNLSITSTPQDFTATSGNSVDVGDVISYTVSNASNPETLLGTLLTVRT